MQKIHKNYICSILAANTPHLMHYTSNQSTSTQRAYTFIAHNLIQLHHHDGHITHRISACSARFRRFRHVNCCHQSCNIYTTCWLYGALTAQTNTYVDTHVVRCTRVIGEYWIIIFLGRIWANVWGKCVSWCSEAAAMDWWFGWMDVIKIWLVISVSRAAFLALRWLNYLHIIYANANVVTG